MAIAARRLTPAQRAWALSVDRKTLDGYLSVAAPVVDTQVLTPPNKQISPKAADVINEEMRAYCAKLKVDVNAYAETWAAKYGRETFRAE